MNSLIKQLQRRAVTQQTCSSTGYVYYIFFFSFGNGVLSCNSQNSEKKKKFEQGHMEEV